MLRVHEVQQAEDLLNIVLRLGHHRECECEKRMEMLSWGWHRGGKRNAARKQHTHCASAAEEYQSEQAGGVMAAVVKERKTPRKTVPQLTHLIYQLCPKREHTAHLQGGAGEKKAVLDLEVAQDILQTAVPVLQPVRLVDDASLPPVWGIWGQTRGQM